MVAEIQASDRSLLTKLVAVDSVACVGLGYAAYCISPIGSAVGALSGVCRLYLTSATPEGFEERRKTLLGAIEDYQAGKTFKNLAVFTLATGTLYGISSYVLPSVTQPICGALLGGFATLAGGGNVIASWTMPQQPATSPPQ